MIRKEILEEVREWLEYDNYSTPEDEVLEAGWEDEEGNEIPFTLEEQCEIQEMYAAEEARRDEERAEEEANYRQWQKEMDELNREYLRSVWVA